MITFIDTETDPTSGKILGIGSIKSDGTFFHTNSVSQLTSFIQDSQYVCGHNILNHDLEYTYKSIDSDELKHVKYIDTLYLSPLLFPCRPYHSLLKDDKLLSDEINNPVNDAKKTRDLFFDEVEAFLEADNNLKSIYYFLLKDKREFKFFFQYVEYERSETNIEPIIRQKFNSQICENANLSDLINNHPVELAYCLALINTTDKYSITPPWVTMNYPEVQRIMFLLRNKPCLEGCSYCNEFLDVKKALKRVFGFESFTNYNGEPLQEEAVKVAVNNKSLLAVLPTAEGKSVTFLLPALMSGENERGLTVVISPLQSLIKDQVDNLEKTRITEVVTINGILNPIERAKSFEKVENGSASILYISPESLRSKSIERLLLSRNVVRFVIDEAHCFSSRGQDFRVDYQYIGDFIKSLQEKKNLKDIIPVSCFTTTAKRNVIEDICAYFKDKLSIDLEVICSNTSRNNIRAKDIPALPVQKKNGIIRIVKHTGPNLITPLVDAICSEELAGTTGVLANTNDDAFQIKCLLKEKGLKAKLIQSNDEFNLYDLLEIRYLTEQLNLSEEISVISDEVWQEAKREVLNRYVDSPNFEILIRLIKEFEEAHPKRKYKSDYEAFIRESKLEHFYRYSYDTIYVSTFSKAKGREFDNVFMMLNQDHNKGLVDDRQLYEAMTRAKEKLIIHYNGDYLDAIRTEGLEVIDDSNYYSSPERLAVQLTHEDVWLDYFYNTQGTIESLTYSSVLKVYDNSCLNINNHDVLKFSKKFKEKVEARKRQGYFPKSAKVNYIINWKKKEQDEEIRIVLPEVYFEKYKGGL